MKKCLLPFVLLFFISLILHAQEPKAKRPGHFGLSFAGIALVQEDYRTNRMRYGGAYHRDSREKMFYTIGFNYIKPISARLDVETGLEYSRRLGEVKYQFLGDAINEKSNSTMASIPVSLRINFPRFFFVNGGLLTDFNLGGSDPKHFETERYQSGLGYVAGLGVKYGFKYGGQIFINPYFKRRSIIEFWENENFMKMDEAGIRVGMYFNTKVKDCKVY